MADTVLVTGAAGFIGRVTVAAARADGSEVIPVEHRWTSAEDLRSRLGDVQVDRCIHLGWYANPQDYLTNAARNLESLRNTLELVEYLASTACTHLLSVGSSAEYAPSDRELGENDPCAPWSVYGAAKASAWLLLQSSLRPAKIGVAWARIFNVTGPGEAADRIVPAVARAAIQRVPIALTDGSQLRDFLDVRDVANALAHLSRSRFNGPANVCSGEAFRLRDLLTEIATEVGGAEFLGWGQRARSATDPPVVVGDDSVLRGTGWSRQVERRQMVAAVVDYWRDSLSWQPASPRPSAQAFRGGSSG